MLMNFNLIKQYSRVNLHLGIHIIQQGIICELTVQNIPVYKIGM